ncbi:MAG: type II secretion system minor pseudopilin GspI [Gammaproteobacteria bacterium]|nr:type II secretion system minor pseudopilin GspI [Gammaproteobacteria bacterium]
MNNSRRVSATGFTLLEVMVALAILAITLGALIKASGSYASNATYLKQKTFAQWIAQNKAVEYQLANQFPAIGNREGDLNYALQEWRWRVKVSTTDDRRLRRLDIDIILSNGKFKKPLVSLVAFVGKPL